MCNEPQTSHRRTRPHVPDLLWELETDCKILQVTRTRADSWTIMFKSSRRHISDLKYSRDYLDVRSSKSLPSFPERINLVGGLINRIVEFDYTTKGSILLTKS